jgi:glutathione S-transferase
MEPTIMRLYHNPLSSSARRVLMAAEHMNTPLDLVTVDLMSEADRRRLGELNPNCKVPVLEDGDFLLWESGAIMQYLAEKTPGQTLYPQDVQARADVNRWMFWGCQHFSPAIGILTWERLWKGMTGNGEADPKEVARGEAEMAAYGTVLDGHLAGRAWLVGDGPTLADYAVAAPLMYLEQASLPVLQYQNMMRWLRQVRELDGWKHSEVGV